MKITFRDDDIGRMTTGHKFEDFKMVHEVFKKYNVKHTVAVICRDLLQNPQIIDYILENGIDPQFHCLDHIRHIDNHDIIQEQFKEGVEVFEFAFGRKPTIWFPSWNLTDDYCNNMAAKYGMEVSYKKVSLDQYIRVNGEVSEDVVNFHYWHTPEQHLIEPALKIYTR